jgi:drug/metabolite transporter (DMT)-like permease
MILGEWKGWGNGLLGVIIFSGSLPATRVAVGAFPPLFLTSARAVIAAVIGGALLFALKHRRLTSADIAPLAAVSAGVVIGFPLLTALALQTISSAHSIVFIGVLPLATALFGVHGGSESPKPAFWFFSVCGSLSVVIFALLQSSDASLSGDLLMLAAVIICGFGYAQGAKLSRRLGGWQVISWALLACLPISLPIALATLPQAWSGIRPAEWAGLAYVSIFSMLVGFVFWYRGLAIGGTAEVGQLQLLQPFFGFIFASFLLHEPVTWPMVGVTILVVGFVASAKSFSRPITAALPD